MCIYIGIEGLVANALVENCESERCCLRNWMNMVLRL